jgi:hypothetical protein
MISRDVMKILAEPFDTKYLSWRAGATTKDKAQAQALVYADIRAYQERLDEAVGGDWDVTYQPWGEARIMCHLTVQGTTRSSTGEFDSSDKVAQGPVAEAQAFKRACVMFGLGRSLYDFPSKWVEYDAQKRKLVGTPSIPSWYKRSGTARTAEQATPLDVETIMDATPTGIGPERAAKLVSHVAAKNPDADVFAEAQALFGGTLAGIADLSEAQGKQLIEALT